MVDITRIKKALVVGLGYRTGLAACNFLAARGIETTASDVKSAEELAGITSDLDGSVTVITGEQSPGILDAGFDLLVLSPGVPKRIPLVQEALERNVPVIAEIELAYTFMKGGIVAVTGTDGKSTTVTLTGHIFNELGYTSFVGGNIGVPLVSLAGETSDETVTVVELSSFQLETVNEFRPDVAVILNINPDHLDRYDSMDEYADAKFRITENQDEGDFFVYNLDDPMSVSRLERVRASSRSYSLRSEDGDVFLKGGRVHIRQNSAVREILDTSRMKIPGPHNVQNAMASILAVDSLCRKSGVSPDYGKIAGAVYSFTGLEHRMELVGEYRGRTFINDSKATTVGSVEMAVNSLNGNTILIMGGRTKGDDYSRLERGIGKKIKAFVLIGESRDYLKDIFEGHSHVIADDLDDAVARSMEISGPGDTILLSPACASFDMFKNYEERGRAFKESFKKLSRGELRWT